MRQIELIDKFEPREYQQTIFAKAINKNTFVVLPTGLGKTVIALMLSVFYFNKTGKKILFLAPTKPLVEQQKKSFEKFIENKDKFNFITILGTTPPSKREELYRQNDFIFSTPQLIENDIISKKINRDDFCFVVFDEAHRAMGNYAYCFIAKEFSQNQNLKSLSLSASPGTKKEIIEEVMSNLFIEHLEIKKSNDWDIEKYTHKTEVKKEIVEIGEEFFEVLEFLNKTYEKQLAKLKAMGFFQEKRFSKYDKLTKTDLLEFQAHLRALVAQRRLSDDIWKAISISAGLMKLDHGIELFSSQEVESSYNYFLGLFQKDTSKAVENLKMTIEFRQAFDKIRELKNNGTKHPKLIKLGEILKTRTQENKRKIKAVVFDVDGVILDSVKLKKKCFEKTLKKLKINKKEGMRILNSTIGRRKIFEKIKKEIISDLNIEETINNHTKLIKDCFNDIEEIEHVKEFIKNNHEKYLFFTNTLMPKNELEKLFSKKDLHKYFKDLFTIDEGDKVSNMNQILYKYNLKKEEIIFFDDLKFNVDTINEFGIHSVLFDEKTNIENEIRAYENPLRVIVFNSYRDTANKIDFELNKIEGVTSSIFVGQRRVGEINFSQKKQKEIIEDFRSGKLNVIVSTSVGEEGLDIPQVDLVVFYEPIPSAIRMIQRIGRTGRFRKGEAIILITNGTRELTVKYIADAKEKSMYKALELIKKELERRSLYDFEYRQESKKEIIEIDEKEFEKLQKNLEFEFESDL